MQRNLGKNINSFRKAIMVPVVLTLLALIPSIRSTYEWLELKTLDILFTIYPEICQLTGQTQRFDTTAAVITKDQTFQTKFGKSPTRSDFAKLLKKLKQQGVQVAALDFIYDEPTKEAEDSELIKELSGFPYPILAQNFIGRGQQSFNIVDLTDKNSERPSWPTPLYKPIADSIAARGLINVPSDFDSVIRYAPLAFHPDESERFLPTLGFSAWIASLISEKEHHISKINITKASSINEAMDLIYASAPYQFLSVGHDGLDRTIRELEALLIYRIIKNHHPELISEDKQLSIEAITAHAGLKTKTWLKLPQEPLPIIGSYHTPCLRIPYRKQAAPFKGDGIESISMTRLLDTEEEENSSYMFSKNQVNLAANQATQTLKIIAPKAEAGKNSLTGEIKTVTGKPVSNATIWAIMPQTEFWQKAQSDANGQYKLDNLPFGNYVINIFMPTENGWEKAMLSFEVTQLQQQLPLLLTADNINTTTIPQALCQSNPDATLWIHGEIIPMLHSDAEGNCDALSLPNGYSLISLNDDEDAPEENFSLDGNGKLLLNDAPSNNAVAAVMPDEEGWQLHFYRKISLNSQNDITIKNLPPSLDSVIKLTSTSTGSIAEDKIEFIIKPGATDNINTLPAVSLESKEKIKLTVQFANAFSKDNKAILIDESGAFSEIADGENNEITSGNYLILTEGEGVKGLYKPVLVNKKTVFIGTSMATDQDFVITPINFLDKSFTHMPGVNVHANLFTTLAAQKFFYAPFFYMDRAPESWPFWQFLIVLPILLLLSIKFKNADSTKTTLIVVILLIVLFSFAAYIFPSRIIIPIFYPSMLVLSFSVTRGFVEWINSKRLARETQSAFGRFISADVVKQIIDNPDAIKPGGEKKELTIIFTDIAGFTSISEKLEPEALTTLMNNYLNEMTNILFKHGGTLDKYIGDAIMGFWNHPTPQEDHTTRAVSCAIDMQKKLRELREQWMAQGLPKVEVRAGINTGNCMVGFIGSNAQMNFTCLGDNVNLASRLEGANKAYGTFIMITEAVKKQLNPYLFSTRFLDFLAVKGKDQPVLVYEVRGWINEESSVWKEKAGNIYQQAIDKYLAREWDNAIALFKQVIELMGEDAPSEVYIGRCNHFKEEPPEANWDGRYILKTK